jgi:death-on-curing protein
MHQLLIRETGGLDGIRDRPLLESAVNAPFQTFGGEELFRSTHEKAARLGYYLIQNHPFSDGNKRIGILAMLTFLELNGIHVDCTDEELVQVGFSLANGTMDAEQLTKWLIGHS